MSIYMHIYIWHLKTYFRGSKHFNVFFLYLSICSPTFSSSRSSSSWTQQFKSAHSAGSELSPTAVCALQVLLVTSSTASSTARRCLRPSCGLVTRGVYLCLQGVLLVCSQLCSKSAVQIHAKLFVFQRHRQRKEIHGFWFPVISSLVEHLKC